MAKKTQDKEMKKTVKSSSKTKKLEELEQQIEELKKENEELKTEHLRARADFENFRKRKEKEMLETRDRAVVDFVGNLLPIIDNFELSLKMTDNKEMFVKGVEMLHKNLIETLKEHHFEIYEPQIGESFDPYLHEPYVVEEDEEPGKVLGTVKKGYKLKDKIVRPAKVKVVSENDSKNEE